MDLYTEPYPFSIPSFEIYQNSTLRPTVPLSDLFKDEISPSSPPSLSTILNSNLNSQRRKVLDKHAKPEDLAAIGKAPYVPSQERSIAGLAPLVPKMEGTHAPNPKPYNLSRRTFRVGSNTHRAQSTQHNRSPSFPNCIAVEDDPQQPSITKATRVVFKSASARRVQMKDGPPFSENLLPNHNQFKSEGCNNEIELKALRGPESESKIAGLSWNKLVKKKTNSLAGRIEVSINEVESVDQECITTIDTMDRRTEGLITCDPESNDDHLTRIRIAAMKMGVHNTRPRLISLREAQEIDECRKENFKSRRAFSQPSRLIQDDHKSPGQNLNRFIQRRLNL
ncbi:hypothetical protein DFH28DRAFT_336767 [Melampsora americana]|nr:hypothetical protein DFH28DRAFT_336767 [Melampsora americana]